MLVPPGLRSGGAEGLPCMVHIGVVTRRGFQQDSNLSSA